MDRTKALELEAALKGKEIEAWTIESLIDNGKSAAVFLVTRGGKRAALKIFDQQLIEKYGDETQLARIKRELQLVGTHHPNMVELIGGGFDKITENHYLLMDFLDGSNLKECLQNVPSENIGQLISQLADCCRFLEKLGLTHRDIKPENIVILDDFKRLVLLDFGVLRPIGEGGLTDDQGVQSFVGTLQYSSPEFLLRKEVDSVEGWRALTFYQIGGVLHDLLMRRELFADRSNPYTRLVMAVQNDIPAIHNSSVPSYLVDLAKACLSKKPEVRTALLNWNSFSPPGAGSDAADSAKTRVTNRQAAKQALQDIDPAPETDPGELLHSVVDTIKIKIRGIRNSNKSSLPPVTVTGSEQQIRVCFGPSESHDLLAKLNLCIFVDILDVSISAISLRVCAFLGDEPKGGLPPTVRIFQGVFSTNSIGGTLEECVYVSVELAQDGEAVVGDAILDLSDLES